MVEAGVTVVDAAIEIAFGRILASCGRNKTSEIGLMGARVAAGQVATQHIWLSKFQPFDHKQTANRMGALTRNLK